MNEDTYRTVIVRATIEFFARVLVDPSTGLTQIEDVYTDERPDWGTAIDADDDSEVDDEGVQKLIDAWTFENPVTVDQFEWSAHQLDLSDKGPFGEPAYQITDDDYDTCMSPTEHSQPCHCKENCEHDAVTYVKREGWYVCDLCGKENVDGPEDRDDLTDDERNTRDTLRLAMERNPGLAFTQEDLDDH
jgi:hypothetical protein